MAFKGHTGYQLFWTAEITERTSRFRDGLAFAGLVWTIYAGTLRIGDDKVTTTQ